MAKWEVDEPGKPADVTAVLADVSLGYEAFLRGHPDIGDVHIRLLGTSEVLPLTKAIEGALDHMRALTTALAEQTARAEAAEAREKALLENNEAERKTLIRHNAAHAARVAELTAKLEAPVQVDAAHIRAEALREAISLAYTSIVHGGLAKSMAHFLRSDDHATYRAAIDAYAEKIEALIPTPSPDVGALERIADRITAQVDCTRETMKQAALPKIDLSTLELLTSHFLDMADDLRAALAKLKGGAE